MERQRQVGAIIRNRRRALGMTQRDLEARTGIEQAYLSRIERGGVKQPGKGLLMTIADALDLDYNEILIPADYAPIGGMEVQPVTPISGERPVRYYGGVPADPHRWGVIEAEERTLDVPLAFIGSRSVDDLFVVTATGDCLHREGIVRGTHVLCAWLRGRLPQAGDVVVVRLAGEVTMKRWVPVDGRVELRDSDERVAAVVDGEVEVLGVEVNHWKPPKTSA